MASLFAYAVMALSGLGGAAALVMSMTDSGGTSCPKCKKTMMPDWNQCLFCQAIPEFELGRPAILHFVSGPLANQAAVLEKPVVTIGSVATNDIVINDPSISRKHVGFRKVEGGYEVADFGSTNGVYVNGERMPKKRLAIGDVVRVGNTEIVFRV
jgi:hypothetical protein